ncbi:MAG: leucine-rich repeat domain-containing protein, partial [Coriobacteriales bacterium]|nr:leucine-rich repeat domain-containing protein [Coriobacteriales bacterium]
EIRIGAFEECAKLRSVAIPESVTRIHGSAFSGCKSLETVTIPESVTEIGGLAFEGCKYIHLNGNSLSVIGKGAFRGCKFIRINGSTPSAIGKDAFGDMLPERIWAEDLRSLTPPLKPAAVLTFAEDPSGSEQRRASHIKYIKSHIPLTMANPSLLDLVIRERLITAKTLPAYLEEARKTGNTEIVAKLMEYAETLQKPGSDLEL